MTAQELNERLNERAVTSLHNPDEVTEAALDAACRETLEEIKRRRVKEWAVMDFAYIRLKIYLKIDLMEDDLTLYREARKEIASSPYEETEDGIKYAQAVVKERPSDWY